MNIIKTIFLFCIVSLAINSCKNSADKLPVANNEFIRYSVNGTAYSFENPVDAVLADTSGAESETFMPPATVTGERSPSTLSDFARIAYSRPTGIGSTSQLVVFAVPQTASYPYEATSATPIVITFTEYGNVGDYIAGNFSCTLTSTAPGNQQYVVDCNFRVKRRR